MKNRINKINRRNYNFCFETFFCINITSRLGKKYDFYLDSEETSCPENTVTWILHCTLSIPTPQHTQSFAKKSPTLMNYVQELFFEQDSKGNVLTETSTLMVFNE